MSKANGAAETPSDFHLVESSGGWTLTVRLTDRLRAALAEQQGEQRESFTVHLEPNLLPADPFEAVLVVQATDPQDTTTEDPQRRSR